MEVEGRLAAKSNYSFQIRGDEDSLFIEPTLCESGSKFRPGPALRSCQPRWGELNYNLVWLHDFTPCSVLCWVVPRVPQRRGCLCEALMDE